RAVFSLSHSSDAGSATLRGLGEANGCGATSSARRWTRRGALGCDLIFSFSGARVFLGVLPWTRGVFVIEPSGRRPGRIEVIVGPMRASFLLASGSSTGGGVTTIIGMTGASGRRSPLMLTGPPGAKAAPTAMLARMRAGTPSPRRERPNSARTRRQSAFIMGERALERVDILDIVVFKEYSIARLSETQVADIRSG
ncbi:hypothetical protein B0H12DRAFT_1138891, partial [Mycena haematopus]